MAETTYRPFASKGRPVPPDRAPGPADAGLASWRCSPSYAYHAFITDRDGATLGLEADHRRHAEIENTIRDLKYGVGLNHLPSGRFGANAAWLALNVIAHNLARWTSRIGLGETLIATDTLRRHHVAMPGRLTRSARQPTLHLPQRWPWAEAFDDLPDQPPRRRAHHLNTIAPSDAADPWAASADDTPHPKQAWLLASRHTPRPAPRPPSAICPAHGPLKPSAAISQCRSVDPGLAKTLAVTRGRKRATHVPDRLAWSGLLGAPAALSGHLETSPDLRKHRLSWWG